MVEEYSLRNSRYKRTRQQIDGQSASAFTLKAASLDLGEANIVQVTMFPSSVFVSDRASLGVTGENQPNIVPPQDYLLIRTPAEDKMPGDEDMHILYLRQVGYFGYLFNGLPTTLEKCTDDDLGRLVEISRTLPRVSVPGDVTGFHDATKIYRTLPVLDVEELKELRWLQRDAAEKNPNYRDLKPYKGKDI